jgi:hypothetical protein
MQCGGKLWTGLAHRRIEELQRGKLGSAPVGGSRFTRANCSSSLEPRGCRQSLARFVVVAIAPDPSPSTAPPTASGRKTVTLNLSSCNPNPTGGIAPACRIGLKSRRSPCRFQFRSTLPAGAIRSDNTLGTGGKEAKHGPIQSVSGGFQDSVRSTPHERDIIFQFRAGFFNSLSHPQFANPDANFTSPTLGVVSSATGNARVGRMPLRFDF